jgi:hypothetical protein
VKHPSVGAASELPWLTAALALTLLFAARTMAPALDPDVVQDDARQYVFWLARLRDPDLFRNDLMADYYQAVTPPGYTAFYWTLGRLCDPLLASKLLPIPLGLVSALFTFFLVHRLHPVPAGAFMATVLSSWYVWQYDDLPSATPRAFVVPLLPAILWALVTARTRLAVGLVVLTALVYPPGGLLGMALLGVRLVRFSGWRPMLACERADRRAFLAAGVLVAGVLLPSHLASTRFGPLVTLAQAHEMPDFGQHGRQVFFVEGVYEYWLAGLHSGLDLRATDARFRNVPILFEYLALATLLPLLLLRRPSLPGVERLSRRSVVLVHLLAASFGLFFLAHVLLLRLYFPSRYVKWSVPLVLAVAAGLALGILIAAITNRVRSPRRSLVAGVLALGLGIALARYPAQYDGHFVRYHHPAIIEFLRGEPKNVMIAGVPKDTNSVVVLAGRSVLVAREPALPFHLGYYGKLKERIQDLVEAYYAESPKQVADFAARYDVDLFLVNRAAFQPALLADAWHERWAPFNPAVSRKLEGSHSFVLLELASRCAIVDDGEVAIVPTTCLRDELSALAL